MFLILILFYQTYAFKLFYRLTSSRSFLKIIFIFQMSYKTYLCFYIINCMPLYVQLYKKCLKDLGRLSTLFPFRALRCGLVGYWILVRRSFKYQLYIMCTYKVIKGPSSSSYALGQQGYTSTSIHTTQITSKLPYGQFRKIPEPLLECDIIQ